MPKQVERRALTREQHTSGTFDRQDLFATQHVVAIVAMNLHRQRVCTTHHLEYGNGDGNTSQASGLTRDESRTAAMKCGNRGFGGDVRAVGEVFIECERHHSSHLVHDQATRFDQGLSTCRQHVLHRVTSAIRTSPSCSETSR